MVPPRPSPSKVHTALARQTGKERGRIGVRWRLWLMEL
ncbi:conserved hypothetical protein [Acidithiobacillus caldus SM-1]|uniref:Uncharacterized protein n=2 Tax=Acidithiobacillus caldus TaxID=33059 RepID=F9ZQW1_ACICS|nr:conserved hypothetical protein [Acidithiobacillus caldus SM-1]AIA56344.1 hypothetical protein Acaty_c2500 [Acidithiobacillus caldus ATCC 51756]QER43603.1 hypothetical protein F0726_00515 [Acidithiobacillus caldus]